MNNYMCVGRLVSDPEVKKLDNGKEVCNITLAVSRSYKNENGDYDVDFIDCHLWNNIASSTKEYCKKGDMIGVKGSLETEIYEKDDGSKRKSTYVAVDRVTFLQTAKEKSNDVEPDME